MVRPRRPPRGFAARRSPASARRSSRSTMQRSPAFCPPGRASTGRHPSGRRSSRCRASRSPSRSGRSTSCPARPRIPALVARSALRLGRGGLGSVPGSSGSRSTTGTTHLCWAVPVPWRRPRARPQSGCAPLSRRGRSSGGTSSLLLGSTQRSRCPHSGTWSGQGRSRTMRGSHSAPGAVTRRRDPFSGVAGGSPASAATVRRRPRVAGR